MDITDSDLFIDTSQRTVSMKRRKRSFMLFNRGHDHYHQEIDGTDGNAQYGSESGGDMSVDMRTVVNARDEMIDLQESCKKQQKESFEFSEIEI